MTEETKKQNNGSSVYRIAKRTKQIFHFVGDVKRTFSGIMTDEILEGEMLKLFLEDGRMLIINKKNLLMTEVFSDEAVKNIKNEYAY